MILQEFLIYNAILGIMLAVMVKTRFYPIKALFFPLILLVLFDIMMADVTMTVGPVINESSVVESTITVGNDTIANETVVEYTYNEVTLDKKNYVWAYIGVLGSILIYMAMKFDTLIRKFTRRR